MFDATSFRTELSLRLINIAFVAASVCGLGLLLTAVLRPVKAAQVQLQPVAEPVEQRAIPADESKTTTPDVVEAGKNDKDSKPTDVPAQSESSFRILDSTGEPVEGARIRLIHQNQTYRELVAHQLLHETTTDADGCFDLPPGKVIANAMDEKGISATWVTVPARGGKPERTWLLGTSAGAASLQLAAVWGMFDAKAVDGSAKVAEPIEITNTFRLPLFDTPLRIVNSDGSPAVAVVVTPTQSPMKPVSSL